MDAAAALHERFVASNDNVERESDEECDGAQLQAVKSKLDADVVPYADFGVFGPRGARFAKIVKYTAQVWDPTTCTHTPKEFKGPRTLDEWRVHWHVYSFALLCFGAVDRARLQQHACQIERLNSDYSNIPDGSWWIIAVTDVRMRSEELSKHMCPIRGTGSSLWLPLIVTSGQHTSKIVPTNSCITSKVRVTSSALMQSRPLERTETVVWTTKQIVPTDPADQNEGKVAPRGNWGATETSKLYGNVARVPAV